MERIGGMVWDADGCTKEKDNNMRDRRSVGGVCHGMCCTCTSTIHTYICYIHSTSKYALYDTVHTYLNSKPRKRVWGGRSISV